jgi:ABC-type transport system involved in multi-copper enzyme maturation permease subunit
MTTAVPNSAIRVIRPHPAQAFGGVWRLTWGRFLTGGQLMLLLGTIALLSLLSLVRIRHAHLGEYIPWTVEFYLGFILPVMAFLSGAAAMRDEMKSTTTDYILTRPIRRTHLVAFKYLSNLVCIQLFYLVVLAALLLLAAIVHVPNVADAVPRLLVAQATTLTCFSALGLLFGVLSSRYLILGILYASTVELAIGRIPTQLNHLSMTHQIGTILQPLNPRAPQLFSASMGDAAVIAMLLGEAALFVVVCAIIYSRREWAGMAGRAT